MGSTNLFLFLSPPPINYLTLNPNFPTLNPNFYPQFYSSLSSIPKRGTNYDAFRGNRFDFDDDFRREKRRNWWSDDDDSDDEEDDDYDEFGFWEEPNPIDWVFKVLSFFGWMVPAVMISMLLGTTGSNSLIMALVIPLGQTALSLVMDRLGGGPSSRSNSSPRYKSRPRPRPGPRSRNRPGANNPFVEARETGSKTSPGSWRTANTRSDKKGGESGSRFGGWDELDEQVGTTNSFSREGQSREVNGLQGQEMSLGKLTRRKNPEKPLFMRLLIAVFPLLGSWTRFLF